MTEQKSCMSFMMRPRALDAPPYNTLSPYAKELYTMLLDRTSLSKTHSKYHDSKGIYVIFRVETAMERLNCSKDRARKAFQELKDAGLITQEKQGQGKPNKTRVIDLLDSTHVASNADTNSKDPNLGSTPSSDKVDDSTTIQQDLSRIEVPAADGTKTVSSTQDEKIAPKNTQNTPSRGGKNRLNQGEKNAPSYTNRNQIDISHPQSSRRNWEMIEDDIKRNIAYDLLINEFPSVQVDGIVQIITAMLYNDHKDYRFGNQTIPGYALKRELLALNEMHIRHVLRTLSSQSTPITNQNAYILRMLWNARMSEDIGAQIEVNRDYLNGNW